MTQVVTTPSREDGTPVLETPAAIAAHTPPPDATKTVPAHGDVEETPRPPATARMGDAEAPGGEDEATPRPAK